MAKKKITEDAAPVSEQVHAPETGPQEENTAGVNIEGTEEVDTTEVENPIDADLPEKEDNNVETVIEPQDTIPSHVLAYFEHHTEEKEVYIDKLGGMFSSNTPKVFLKDAVLYQNPFFKQ